MLHTYFHQVQKQSSGGNFLKGSFEKFSKTLQNWQKKNCDGGLVLVKMQA